MTADDIRHALHRAPFRPFVMHLADGNSIQVPHPDFVALMGDGLSAIITSPTDHGYDIVDLLLVTRLELPRMKRKASS